MPITPTPGDDALAAGMPLVPGVGLASDLEEYINQTRDIIAQRTSTVQPIAKGGTGATTAAAARTNLGITGANTPTAPSSGGASTVQADLDYLGNTKADASAVASKATLGTDVTFGHIYTPSGRATPVSTSYVAGYINSDGRIGATPSARKYKRDIETYEGSVLDLEAVTYVLKDDDLGTVRLGIIADDADLIEPLLVVHENREPESFKYELLAVALLKEVQRLAARIDALERAR